MKVIGFSRMIWGRVTIPAPIPPLYIEYVFSIAYNGRSLDIVIDILSLTFWLGISHGWLCLNIVATRHFKIPYFRTWEV